MTGLGSQFRLPEKIARIFALAALLFAAVPDMRPYTFIHTPGGQPIKWNPGPIPIKVMLGTPPLNDGSDYTAAFLAAMSTWNGQIATSQFMWQVLPPATALQGNAQTEVVFAPNIYGESFPPNALAVCINFGSVGTQRTEADIFFNTQYQWGWYAGTQASGKQDLFRVGIHELGHALGLDHPDQAGQTVVAVMNANVSNTYTLAADDIAGAQTLYGAGPAPPPANLPSIIIQPPVTLTVADGRPTSMFLTAISDLALAWRWQIQRPGTTTWIDIDPADETFTGGATANLAFIGRLPLDQTKFRCVVSTTAGSVVSKVTTLLVVPVPPKAVRAVQILPYAFEIYPYEGSAPLTYQWQMSVDSTSAWTNIHDGPTFIGTDARTLEVMPDATLTGGNYSFRCLVANSVGQATPEGSQPDSLGYLAIVRHPETGITVIGQPATFSVKVTGRLPLKYQWDLYRPPASGWVPVVNDALHSGATLPTLSVKGYANPDVPYYRCRISDRFGNKVESAPAMIIAWATPQSPYIKVQPQPVVTPAGTLAGFAVDCPSGPIPSFQWQTAPTGSTVWTDLGDDEVYKGAHESVLQLYASAHLNGRSYRCVLTNSVGQSRSNPATLTVTTTALPAPPPVIVQQPDSVTVAWNENASFVVTATGSSALTYTWWVQPAGAAAPGHPGQVTGQTLNLRGLEAMDGTRVRCVIRDASQNILISRAVTLTVTGRNLPAGPAIRLQPAAQEANLGQQATFEIMATGTTPLTYQWQVRSVAASKWEGSFLPGASTNRLTVDAAPSLNANEYRCVVTNEWGMVRTDPAVLSVGKPVIATHPAATTAITGATAAFTVSAYGTAHVLYRWQVSLPASGTWTDLTEGGVYSGTSNRTLLVSASASLNGCSYRCVISNTLGQTASDPAVLTVP